ncbi:MAG: hypothetical protein IKZ94_05735 [Lachnospiraceae bacterium]|nr:hypothetical protein [Lachnospiraceae bacterium]
MKRKTALFIVAAVISTGLLACGKETAKTPSPETEAKEAEVTVEEVKEEPEVKLPNKLETEEEIISFLEGEWRFLDIETNEDFATISFDAKGNFKFERDFDKTTLEGDIKFNKMYAGDNDAPDEYTLTATSVNPGESSDIGYEMYEDMCESDGIFYITSANGLDYMQMKEVGNGESFIMAEVFRNGPVEGPAYDYYNRDFVIYRESKGTVVTETKKNESFYAYAWGREGEALLLQTMIPHERQDYNEYTERHFIGAYFSPDELSSVKYEVSDDLDTRKLFYDKKYKSDHPLMMYSVLTDNSGKVTAISEVDTEIYGAYDLGEGENDISVDGMIFKYNDMEIDMTDVGPANVLMDCTKVGDRILIEGHVNPHYGAWYVYDTNTGDYDVELYAGQVIYYNGDITTAVYSINNEVYNYAGDLIGWFDEGEILDLQFTNNNQSVKAVNYTFVDGDEIEEEKEFEIPETGIGTIYKYLDFCATYRSSKWAGLIDEAPNDAKGLVIVDAPDRLSYYMHYTKILDENADEQMIVAALQDETVITVESGEPEFKDDGSMNWKTKEVLYEQTLEKAEAVEFTTNITEGIPDKCIRLKADGEEKLFPIQTLSGENPLRCKFID